MPLKAIYERSPLVPLLMVPMRPGCIHNRDTRIRTVYQLLADKSEPAFLNGRFLLACACEKNPTQSEAAGLIRTAFGNQHEDGSFAGKVGDEVAIALSVMSYYQMTAERPVLEGLLKWACYVRDHLDNFLSEEEIYWRPADLLGLLLDLYRFTGKPWVYTLLMRVNDEAADWYGILNHVDFRKPVTDIAEDDQIPEDYRKQLACSVNGESLADGMRAAFFSSMIRPGGRATEIAKNAWDRLMKYHGSVIGTVNCAPVLAGMDPCADIDTASVGAWAETLCICAEASRSTWCFDALDVLMENALTAVTKADGVPVSQRVNTFANKNDAREDTCRARHALCRVARAWAACLYHAVCTVPEGVCVNWLMDDTCYTTVQGKPMVLRSEDNQLTVQKCNEASAKMLFRIPGRPGTTSLRVGMETPVSGQRGTWLAVSQNWKDGDTVSLETEEVLIGKTGYHQSVQWCYGKTVLCVPLEDTRAWNMAAVTDAAVENDGCFTCTVRLTDSWKKRDGEPGATPVLPETSGETKEMKLLPYATQNAKITVLPRGKE